MRYVHSILAPIGSLLRARRKIEKQAKDKYVSRWLGALGSVTPPWQYTVLFHKP